jgi:hypothetical protein
MTCPSVSRITPPRGSRSKRRSHLATSKVYLISTLRPPLGFKKEHEMDLPLGFSTHSATQVSLPSSSTKLTWHFCLSLLALSLNQLDLARFLQGNARCRSWLVSENSRPSNLSLRYSVNPSKARPAKSFSAMVRLEHRFLTSLNRLK